MGNGFIIHVYILSGIDIAEDIENEFFEVLIRWKWTVLRFIFVWKYGFESIKLLPLNHDISIDEADVELGEFDVEFFP